MRLDNTASIACGTFVQNHTQMHRSLTHSYRRLFGICERYICEREVTKRKLSIIRQVLPASSPFKPVRKCIALSRTLIDACPGSVTLHPDVVFLRRETICSTLFLFPTPLLLLQVEVEEEVKEEVLKTKLIKARQNRILPSVTSKMRRAHFPNEQAPRANEGGKNEFLRVRRARDIDTLPQKERKPRLKQSISRRRRAKPRRDKAFP